MAEGRKKCRLWWYLGKITVDLRHEKFMIVFFSKYPLRIFLILPVRLKLSLSSPYLFLAMHSYWPKSSTVTGLILNSWRVFGNSSVTLCFILFGKSSIGIPSYVHVTSASGLLSTEQMTDNDRPGPVWIKSSAIVAFGSSVNQNENNMTESNSMKITDLYYKIFMKSGL